MSTDNTARPALWYDAEQQPRKIPDRETIPRRLVYAMFGLALASLAIASFAVLSGRPPSAQPADAAVVRAHTVTIEGETNVLRVVETGTGRVLLDGNGGFIAVVNDGLRRARLVAGVEGNGPVTISQHENGRVSLFDPASGWRVELSSFGPGNLGTFLTMLNGN